MNIEYTTTLLICILNFSVILLYFKTKSINKYSFNVEKKRKYILINRFYRYLNLNLLTVFESQVKANKNKKNVKYSKIWSII